MTPEDYQKMQLFIAEAVKVTVNGKIDKISTKLDEHIQQHEQDRKDLQPMIEAFKGKSWLSKQIVSSVIVLGGFGGLMAGIAEIFNLFIKH